ncbi:hypothetical protein HXV92_00535 [Chlamydia psittaci]|uniref:hypothetical protein n=1 Tax=Chlamydia psittaci TaxID=83554 RepID=UPI0018664113|nr:hypothetical protein [Chlamydia psittaci]MBE3635693.1 hypothetical protein [Chlamydia psittaci]BEU43980.1 hypothetical protein NRM5_002930 [Chlamydia psittaci]
MCCPLGECGCKLTVQEGVGGPSQENIPLKHVVVTQQPGTGNKVSFEVHVGDNSVAETIQKAGAVASSLLNAPQTQRGASYCNEHCSPWCDSHCPNWLSHCFHCLCTCIINPPEQPSGAHPDLLSFLDDMKRKHGPIVLGMGAERSGFNWSRFLSEGVPLTDEQKDYFDSLCVEAKRLLKKLLAGGIQQELFDLANDPKKVPEVNDIDTIMAKRGYGDFRDQKHNIPPQCWVIYNKGEGQGESPGSLQSEIHYAKHLDYLKLRSQLYHLNVVDLGSRDVFPLGGKEGKNALQILQNTLACLVGHAPCLTFGIPGYSLGLSPESLLKLIILALLALGYAPTNNKGEIPSATFDQLKQVSDFFKTQWDMYGRPFLPGDNDYGNYFDDDVEIDGGKKSSPGRNPKPPRPTPGLFNIHCGTGGRPSILGDDAYDSDGLEIDGGKKASPGRTPQLRSGHVVGSSDDEDDDADNGWCSNQHQAQLLGLCSKISRSAAFLG